VERGCPQPQQMRTGVGIEREIPLTRGPSACRSNSASRGQQRPQFLARSRTRRCSSAPIRRCLSLLMWKAETDRRIAEIESGSGKGVPLEESLARLQDRRPVNHTGMHMKRRPGYWRERL
jgi:hypothetical protein